MTRKTVVLIIIVIVMASYMIGYHFGIGNQEARYGDSGSPKNCRALKADNLKGVFYNVYTASEALNSIERNCGPNGLIWNER